MTKQAAGQFVTHLEGTGHLTTRTDPADRRVRLVVAHAAGRPDVEGRDGADPADRAGVGAPGGAERYAEFRDVLEDLVATGAR